MTVGQRVRVLHGDFSDELQERRGIIVKTAFRSYNGMLVRHFDGQLFAWGRSEVKQLHLSWLKDLFLCLRLGWRLWRRRR